MRRLAWPVRGADAGEAAGFRFDHGLEVAAAQRALLFQVDTNPLDFVFGKRLVEQSAVRAAALREAWSQSRVGCVGVEQHVFVPAMPRATRPRKHFRVLDHARADGIEVDVSVAAQDVVLAADEAGFVGNSGQSALFGISRDQSSRFGGLPIRADPTRRPSCASMAVRSAGKKGDVAN
jgi:hypothetical protein